MREILGIPKGLNKRNGIGGGERTEVRGVRNRFPWGSPRAVLPAPFFAPPPLRRSLVDGPLSLTRS